MKKTVELSLDTSAGSIDLIDRFGSLVAGIEKWWIGKQTSHIGLQYVDLEEGRIVVKQHSFERRDIASVQYFDVANCFIERDGRVQIDLWDGIQITKAERQGMLDQCKDVYTANPEFVAFQNTFFTDEPWKRCAGQTPEEAVATLRAWHDSLKRHSCDACGCNRQRY